MKKLLTLTLALVALGWVSFATASINLNSSRSNVYRVMHSPSLTPAQVTAILARLDKGGPGVNEATVKQILKEIGVGGINRILILPPNKTSVLPTIILLMNPADEQEARLIAGSDSGTVSIKQPAIIKK